MATSALTGLSAGAHTVEASYSGNGLLDPSTVTQTITVNRPPPTATTTALSVDPPSPARGSITATLLAFVTPAGTGGTVEFLERTTRIGEPVGVDADGRAQIQVPLEPGTYSFSVVFTPADQMAYAGSASEPVSYLVQPRATTTATALGVDPPSPVQGATNATLTATVSPAGATGKVEFFDGYSWIGGPAPIAGDGPASIQLPLGPRTYSLRAVFTPDDPTAYTGSSSVPLTYVVEPTATPTPTATALIVDPPSPAPAGTLPRVSFTVSPAGATGSVELFDGTTLIGGVRCTLTCPTSIMAMLGPGTYSFTAVFTPDDPTAYTGSTSQPLPYVIEGAG